MQTTCVPKIALPDGYVACERIGSGGYGEVWRATAPGGVDKAVKVVFGHCDEELAERELKSLERIRSVRHPFVISLERFEIVDNRLVIVTELADMSLEARYRICRSEGLTGIPRDELIAYLQDAAEALDYLVDQHSLQHLDIKPENLLVVGRHVKVADFGLVKELATRTLNSMMGGMTPLYSAPEVFDDDPSPRSDQYSLAIVFQQLLTGQVPFPGRTPAQLAKQHTQAEPNVSPLPGPFQSIIRRALSKRPEHRFESCCDFTQALVAAIQQAASAGATGHRAGSAASRELKDDDTRAAVDCKTHPVGAAAAFEHGSSDATSAPATELYFPRVQQQVDDIDFPEFDTATGVSAPTLVVGLGGIGTAMLVALRKRLATSPESDPTNSRLACLAIDTDRESLKIAATQNGPGRLSTDEYLHISLKRPKDYGEQSRQLLNWVSRRWLYNIPRSLETRGYRPLGRIAAVDHAEPILRSLYDRLGLLAEAHAQSAQLRVVVLASTSGGTGGGIVVDVGQAVRSLGADLGVDIAVEAILAMPTRAAGVADSLPAANTFSLLSELNHAQELGNVGATRPVGAAARFESSAAPFDHVDWVALPAKNQQHEYNQTIESIAERLALEVSHAGVWAAVAATRKRDDQREFRLGSFDCRPLAAGSSLDDALAVPSCEFTGCRYKRMRLLLAAQETAGADFCSSNQQACAEAKLRRLPLPVEQDVLLSVAIDISPLHLAAGLACFFPDIADAASRLRSRDDIAWRDLRQPSV
jgi:hypothetical protein